MAGFEFDDKANAAVINGVSASGQVGLGVPAAFTGVAGLKPTNVPPPAPVSLDMSISSGLGQQTSAMMADLFKPQAQAAPAASVGYKPDTNQLWSNGRVYDAGDLTALLKAEAAGDLEGSNAPVPQDFNLADPSQFKAKITSTPDWKKEGMASLRNYGAGMAAIGSAMGSDAATSKFNQWNEEADLLSRSSSAPKTFDEAEFGKNFLPYIRQLGIQSVPYLAEALVSGFGLGSLFKQGGVAAAKQFAEGAIRKETTRILATSATRVTAEEALEQATKAVGTQLARSAGVVAGTYPSSVGDILSNQYDQSKQFDLGSAAALGVPYAGLNLVGLEGLAGGVGRMTRTGGIVNNVARGAATGAATTLGEGLNEVGQEVINQFGRMAVDPRANLSDPSAMARYKEAFIGGALLGGVVGAPRGVYNAITPGDMSPTELTQRAEQRQAGWRQEDMLANFVQGVEAAPMADYDVGPFRTPVDAFFQGLPADMQTYGTGTYAPRTGSTKKKFGPQIPLTTPTGPVQMPQMEGLAGMPANGYESLTPANQPTPLPEQGAPVAAVQPEAPPAAQTAPMFKGKKANELWNAAVAELGEGHEALGGINQALTENKAGVAKKLLTQAIQEKQAAFPVKGATSGQQRVVDYLGQAINEGRADDVVDAQGVLQYQKIGEALGLKRGSVKSFVNGAIKALAKQQGKTVDELKAALKARAVANRVTEESTQDKLGLAPAQQESVVNETDLFGSAEGGAQQTMGIVESVGGSQANIADDMRDLPVVENPVATEQETKASKREMNRRFEAELEAMRMQRRKDAEAAFASGDAIEGEVLPPELRDYAGNPIKQVDIDDAAAEWEDREGSPLPDEIRVQWTKAYIANQDGVLNDRHFQEIYLELSAKVADGVPAPVNGQPVLEGPAVSRDVRVDNGAPAAEKVVRQESGAGEEISAQGVIDRWNKGARALGLPAYGALDAEHQDYLQGSGTWAEFDEAAAEISDEINNDGTPTFSELEAVGSSLYNDDVHLSNGVVVDQVGETEVRQYVVRGEADEQIGTATIGIRDGKPNAVYHIALFPAERGKGWGRKIVQSLLDSSTDGLYIQNTVPDAVGFWKSMGATWLTQYEEHGDAIVQKPAVSESVAGDAAEGTQRQEVSRKLSEDSGTPNQGTNAAEVTSRLKKLFFSPEKFDKLVTVVQSAADLSAYPEARSVKARGTTQAFVSAGHVFLIADNIKPGRELAVFLHEVGAHLGMAKLIGQDNMARLAMQIKQWAIKNDGSMESELAKKALGRVKSAQRNGVEMNAADSIEERIAYFIEEAVLAGVNPSALRQGSPTLRQWFELLVTAMKVALRKLGVNVSTLSATNIVDLAMGAAHEVLMEDTQQTRDALLFSEAATENPAFAKAGAVVDDLLADPKGWLEKLKLGFLTLEQLAWSTKSAAVQAYNKAMTDMQKVSKDIVYEASLIDQKWAGLSDAESDALSSVMTRSTMEQFDPSTSATPENDEQRKIKSAYSALPASAKKLYAEVRDQYAKLLKKREAIMLDMAVKAKLHGKELSDIKEMFGKVKGPYFPLMRIGKFYAVGMSPRLAELEAKFKAGTLSPAEDKERARLRKDEKHYITTSHQSEREAKRTAAKYAAEGRKAYYNEQEEKLRAAAQKFPGFAQMEASITDGIEDSATRQRVSALFTRMLFDLAPEHSALKQMMKREGIAGAHEDMRQVFAKSMLSQAHYISRLQHQHDVTKALFDVKQEGQEGNITMRRVGNELTKRMEQSLEFTDSPVLDALMNVSYFAHLGVSPAFILINSTQVPMIALPYLAARHGFRKTNTALAQAFKDTTSIIKTTLGKDGGWRSEIDWSKQFKKGSPEDLMFRELLDRNLLDITMEHDLGATARMGGGSLSAGNLAKMASTPTRITEYANRAVTALAAYRLAIADGKSHAEATDAAAKAVSMTQLNYSGLNAPRHMQSVLGSKSLARMMMQFRKYQQGMLYLLASNISDALHGESPKVRKEARNTLLGLFATTGTMAGALGLPFIGTLGALANLIAAAFGDSDDPWDYETALRNWLADTLGKDVGQAVAKGIPAALGADLSKRVGMGDIASPMPFVREGRTAQETAGNLAVGAMGAPVGMMVSMYDGLGQMLSGEISKGAEKIIPLKAAKDALKAVRYGTEGMTDKRGNVILSSGQFDPWDLALRGSGFAPTKESEYYEANRAVQDSKTATEDARSKLLNQYSRARRAGESTDDIDAKIAAFNERHPEKGVRIDASSKLKAVQQGRKLDSSRNEAGVVVDKRTKPYVDNARFANP